MRPASTRRLAWPLLLLLALALSTPAPGGVIVEDRAARAREASDVIAVRWLGDDRFLVTESFFGPIRRGTELLLKVPLTRYRIGKSYSTDDIESYQEVLQESTMMVLFLQADANDPNHVTGVAWAYSDEEKSALAKEIRAAIVERKRWESALAERDPAARRDALWPLALSGLYQYEALVALTKLGPVAGDLLAERLAAGSQPERGWIFRAGEFKSARLHAEVLRQLDARRAQYDRWAQGAPPAQRLAHGYDLPAERKSICADLQYAIVGLVVAHDSGDLPYLRGYAHWLVQRQLPCPYGELFEAFRANPARENLPALAEMAGGAAWWRPYSGDESFYEGLAGTLGLHRYPESVPLLVPLLALGDFNRGLARGQLRSIVGTDLGEAPGPWLDWARRQER